MLDMTITARNYSHCPLKKRPIQYDLEEDMSDEELKPPAAKKPHVSHTARTMNTEPIVEVKIEYADEPENLSTKPEDLSKRSPPAAIHAPCAKIPPTHQPEPIKPPMFAQLPRSGDGGAFHRVVPSHPVPEWFRKSTSPASGPIVPEPIVPYYSNVRYYYTPEYPSHQSYPLYPSPPSPYAPRDNSCSPPYMPTRTPLAPLALIPDQRYLSDRLSMSPASTVTTSSLRSHSPASSSETIDLSPPLPTGANLAERRSAARHQCPDCGKSYSTFSGLSKHQQFHCAAGDGPKKVYSCKHCPKTYVSMGALKMHIRTHTLPCKCTLCGKAFSRPWLLQGHIRTHTGEKPFSCQYCHRAFADRSNLRAHLQTHSDVKKYACATCSKQFSRMSLLTKHAETGCTGNLPQPFALDDAIKTEYLTREPMAFRIEPKVEIY